MLFLFCQLLIWDCFWYSLWYSEVKLSINRLSIWQADAKQHTLAKYLMELTLIDYDMVHHRPSEIAAAALCLSQKILGHNKWVSALIKLILSFDWIETSKQLLQKICVGSYAGDQMRVGQPDACLQVEKRNKPLKTFFFVNSEVWKDFSLESIVTEGPTVNKGRCS